jgi:integrase
MRLRKRAGVWHCRFYDIDGRRIERSTHCHDRKAAETIAAQWERDAADPDHAAAHKATLGEILNAYVASVDQLAEVGKKAKGTASFHRVKAGHWLRVLEQGGAQPFALRRLRSHHVDDYISTRRKEGAGENTIAKELVTLRAALKYALRRQLWVGVVEAILPSGFAPQYKPKERALPPHELQLLLAQLTADQAARVAFIVATSANWAETERAQRSDIQDNQSTVHIRGTKRTSRLRDVPIVSEHQSSLLRHAVTHAKGVDGMLFLPWANVRRDLHDACKRAKIERCSPNDLRRTFAQWMRKDGVPAELVAPAMGHADTRMVERVYGKLPTEVLRQRMASALGVPCPTFAPASADKAIPNGFGGQTNADFIEEVVPRGGIEPPTRGFSILCSTN